MSKKLQNGILLNGFYNIVVSFNEGKVFTQVKDSLKTICEVIEFPYGVLKQEMKYSYATGIHRFESKDGKALFSVLIVPGTFANGIMVKDHSKTPTFSAVQDGKVLVETKLESNDPVLNEAMFATAEHVLTAILIIEETLKRREQK